MDKLTIQRGIADEKLAHIMAANPLAAAIPVEYGGRGGLLEENLALLSMAAYESLALSLTFGINSALFLQPFARYAQNEVKAPVFKRILEDKNMGGLMITEPDHGSDALNMDTSHAVLNGKFHLKGTKHWAGLTGKADFWLLTARKKNEKGFLERDIDFFLCDQHQPGQKIVVEEYFENLGLYQIPYGRNKIDVQLPLSYRLIPETNGVHMMLNLLHRSRLHFPGMGLGLIQRMLDESIQHATKRHISAYSLLSFDQVQARIAKVQAAYTICSAFCYGGTQLTKQHSDLTPFRLEANVIKTVTADLMQESTQTLLQLVGAKGYRLDHIAGRSTVDSRPYQIFEGSNDILYTQIAEYVLRSMKKIKDYNFTDYIKGLFGGEWLSPSLKEILNFKLDPGIPQRKMVEFGKLVSRVVSIDYVAKLEEAGFRTDMAEAAIETLVHEIRGLVSSFSSEFKTTVIEDYAPGSSWDRLV
jgi:alkylation response protein AidB-like acyl-CoA dehydrogenase